MTIQSIQQVELNAKTFHDKVVDRDSRLVSANDNSILTEETFIQVVKHSRLNLIDERCIHTNRRKATWSYDRLTGKPMLHRLYRSKSAHDTFSHKS